MVAGSGKALPSSIATRPLRKMGWVFTGEVVLLFVVVVLFGILVGVVPRPVVPVVVPLLPVLPDGGAAPLLCAKADPTSSAPSAATAMLLL